MKVYIVTEYGGSYDDSWDHIIGVFTDKARAEEVKDTYWNGILTRRKELEAYQTAPDLEEGSEESWTMYNEWWDNADLGGVKIDEHTLDEFLGGYYHGQGIY